uniref:Uncharacterized protein n=1 Tax=Candidatus Kentrum sp. FW TaxID=2126338 RepID=A0A450U1U3_9GAMM|nr:MAG: hypothetical protein BECKFW1821C_GA0114237_11073 [Candidatus Kentron sp. FW]
MPVRGKALLSPGILLRGGVGGRYNPYVIPEKNTGT